jgi:hypothetical protein
MLLVKCKMQKNGILLNAFFVIAVVRQKEAKQVSGMFSLHLPTLKLAELNIPNLFLHPYYCSIQQHLNSHQTI